MLIRGRASQKLKQLEMGRMGSEMSGNVVLKQWLGT